MEMMANDCYPDQDNCILVKLLTQSMHSEHFLNFDRKITKSRFFFNGNSLYIFVK